MLVPSTLSELSAATSAALLSPLTLAPLSPLTLPGEELADLLYLFGGNGSACTTSVAPAAATTTAGALELLPEGLGQLR